MLEKKFLAAAVAGAFALPGIVLAEDAPKSAIPTLSQIFDASGVSLSGYIDTAYTHANRDIETGYSDRQFDSQNNSFGLHQVGLTVAKQPKEGFGGLVNITAGTDAKVINTAEDDGSTSNFNVTQAYGQYAVGALTVIAGKFTTLQGTEVIASPSNMNFSRSLLFFGEPLTHTGLRATYAVNDKVSLIAGVNNGWNSVTDANKGKTLELGATLTPIKPLTIAISDYNGKEGAAGSEATRNSFNMVATYTVIDPLTLGAEYLRVTQDIPGADKAKYSGVAGYATYMFAPKWRGTLRAEWVKDDDGVFTGIVDNKLKETTLTIAYLPADSFEVRGELRSDHSDSELFLDPSSGALSKSLTTYALQAIYKF